MYVQGNLVQTGVAVTEMIGYNLKLNAFDSGIAFGDVGALWSLCNTEKA